MGATESARWAELKGADSGTLARLAHFTARHRWPIIGAWIVLTMFGASWAPAISFAMLLGVLAVRPQGLFGRRS